MVDDNNKDDFEQWHAGLNKLVHAETGQPVTLSDSMNAEVVLATPSEAQEIQSQAWLEQFDANKPHFEDKNGEPVTLTTKLSDLDM